MGWEQAVAQAAEHRLAAHGIRLTLGGEPTLVPLQPQGPEWSVSADGPTKLPLARRLAQELQRSVWPGSTLLFCPGKCYEGEVNPRWALRLITGVDGTPPVHWPGPCQPGLEGEPLAPEQAEAWLERLGQRLGVALPEPLPLRDPLDDSRRVWAVPLACEESWPNAPEAEPTLTWCAHPWPLAEERRALSGAPGPAGLRLPLQHLPEALPRQVLTLEIGAEGWQLFLPPLNRRPLTKLLQAVADSLEGLAAPGLAGVLPWDTEGHWQVLGLAADPGVLEINLPVCPSWADYDAWLRRLENIGASVGLRSWQEDGDGRQRGTGGGNHLLWGGPSLAEHPFFPRPAWLVGVLRYWQHHPSLAYLFAHPSVGPASQSPRPDEAAGGIAELELAYRCLEQAGERENGDPRGDHRALIGETLRHLHADRSGNNHRSEISVDKFWNPGTPAGCLGLVEFRALESLPQASWSSAVALLWSALAAHLLEPAHRPTQLRDWGRRLHDRALLPSRLWADLEAVLADLAGDGLALEPDTFQRIWAWRFPPLLTLGGAEHGAGGGAEAEDVPGQLTLRPALEPWPLICDFPREGGFTSRFVDGSLRRFEVCADGAFRSRAELWLNGRPLPLPAGAGGGEGEGDGEDSLLAVRFRQQRLYPCLHPAIEPHLPLQLQVRSASGRRSFQLNDAGDRFLPLAEDPAWPDQAPPWSGRLQANDVTIDLRVEDALTG
ncbi:MAG: transglutaminase family protein [Synechococcaceae cyanobacterium]|nr:transglutaminase family protein [Synechococcaceae cyanobacterium]